MTSQKTHRRRFLGAAAATAGAGLAAGALRAAGPAARGGANDTLNIALIGCGARGRRVLSGFQALEGVRVVAACDLNSKHLAGGIQQAGGSAKVKAYHDFRKLMENKDVDAVIVATQPHWHVLLAIAACQAGKDVYLEKPLGNSIGEGRYAIEAARKYKRIVQIGTQQRSQAHYRKAVQIVQSGRLGEVSQVQVWDHENWWPGAGFPADCDPPGELDWDFYVGPAPYQPYNPNIYANYGYDWFKLSGAGHQVAWGVHHFDIVLWAMKVDAPTSVSATGGFFAYRDNREWPNTLSASLAFGPGPVAKLGFVLEYSMRMGCKRERRSHGKCFLGSEASLYLDRSGYSIVSEPRGRKGAAATGLFVDTEEVHPVVEDDRLHHCKVFLENVRTRRKPFASTVTGHHASNVGHLMNMAWQVGRSIRWDGATDRVIDDPEANALVTKPYRAPWKLVV